MLILIGLLCTAAQADDGAQIYATTCASCHGAKGAGDGPAGGALPVKPADFTSAAFWAERDGAAIRKAIAEGGPAVGKSPLMPPFGPALGDSGVEAVATFLATLRPKTEAPEANAPQGESGDPGIDPAVMPEAEVSGTAAEHLAPTPKAVPKPDLPQQDVRRGKKLYRSRCAQCHGIRGDGSGPTARYLQPRPRDFTTGTYKFKSTPAGSPAAAADLFRTITAGMPGTAMPGWGMLSAEDRWQLVFYMQSMSDRFDSPEVESIPIPPAPAVSPDAVARGAQVYTQSGCAACHGVDGRGDGPGAAAMKGPDGRALQPFDLTRGWRMKGGGDPTDLYRLLQTGIEGTPMPSFAHLDDDDTWDLVHFVRSLSPNQD